MIIIPRENPVIKDLNSYYLDIDKLIEHYQGEIGAGAVHLKSASVEAIIFFDENDILNGIFQDKNDIVKGPAITNRLEAALMDHVFTVAVYKINAADLVFWANLHHAEEYYRNLSTDFTDLDGLIKKMQSEKITGYIEIAIGDGTEGGVLFFNNGVIIGDSCSWENKGPDSTTGNQELLIRKSKESGGVFNVSKISFNPTKEGAISDNQSADPPSDLLPMIEELLTTFEKTVNSRKKIKAEFNTLLRGKFVEKADEYEFLDPFAADFQYVDETVVYAGEADHERLAKAVFECVVELADELGLRQHLPEHLSKWATTFSKEIARINLRVQ